MAEDCNQYSQVIDQSALNGGQVIIQDVQESGNFSTLLRFIIKLECHSSHTYYKSQQ